MALYDFTHLMQICIFPPGLNIILVIIGLLLCLRWNRLGKTIIFFAVMSLWLASTPIIAQRFIDHLQNQYQPLSFDHPLQPASAIVVLGGGYTHAHEYLDHLTVSEATFSRLRYSAYIHDATHLPIIVSGGKIDDPEKTEADLMANVLAKQYKIPIIWKENKSINTHDEGRFLIPILQEHDIAAIYLITHAWHMPRSVYSFHQHFQHTNIKIIPAPMGYVKLNSKQSILNYFPSLDALNVFTLALHEYVGMGWYYFYY